MNILLIGSGGREHALAWLIKQSPQTEKLYCLPGNAGVGELAELVGIKDDDFAGIATFCKQKNIGLVFVGPEAPLVAGIADYLEKEGIRVFGPSKKAAQLEGSKKFTKDLCIKYNIPTAAYGSFTDAASAKAFLKKQSAPIVVKADGLAAGKGVVIAESIADAEKAIDEMFAGKFGTAGNTVVIEEFLDGEEASFFAVCDGKIALAFGSAQDHKRVGDGDTGPNTGGMGTYSPAPVVTDALHKQVMETIVNPLIHGMAKDGIPYKGILFAGLMVTKKGPQLLEINTRFGDPETQVLLPRFEGDFVQLLIDGADGKLTGKTVKLKSHTALCVVMAAEGYPGDYVKGTEIKALDTANALPDVTVFHAGTKKENGKIIATGGRVLGVTALGKNALDAQQKAYRAVDAIDWPQGFCRRDIGWRAIRLLKAS